MEWKQTDGVRRLEASLPGARSAFTTRIGGVSAVPYDEANLGYLTGDEPASVATNRERLAGALDLDPSRVVIGRQVHGAELAIHAGPQNPSPYAAPGSVDPPEVDGHLTGAEDLALLVFVADCLPIALAGPGGIAMLHGGWRPLAGGIVERGVAGLVGAEGPSPGTDPASLGAAIGPGIGPCCFEVGPEVLDAFEPLGPDIADGRMLDLPEVARRLLERAGVVEVEIARECTRCNPDLYFSHRGLGPGTGRQGGLIWRTEG